MKNYFEEYRREESIKVEIGEEEWDNFPYENKVRLLYRLKQSRHKLAQDIAKAVEHLVEEEKLQKEIDYDRTFQHYYGDSV